MQTTAIGVLLSKHRPGWLGVERYLTSNDPQNQFHQQNPHPLGFDQCDRNDIESVPGIPG